MPGAYPLECLLIFYHDLITANYSVISCSASQTDELKGSWNLLAHLEHPVHSQ